MKNMSKNEEEFMSRLSSLCVLLACPLFSEKNKFLFDNYFHKIY